MQQSQDLDSFIIAFSDSLIESGVFSEEMVDDYQEIFDEVAYELFLHRKKTFIDYGDVQLPILSIKSLLKITEIIASALEKIRES